MARGTFGGILGATAPGAPTAPVAFGGVESATLTWVVPSSGESVITSFTITPYLGGEIAQAPLTVLANPDGLSPVLGANDQYVVPTLLIGFYSFTVAANNASANGLASPMSNLVGVLAPPASLYNYVYISHLGLPIGLAGDGTFFSVLQDTIDEVAQSVEVIVGTVTGERTVVPSFGVADPAFSSPGPNTGNMQAAIQKWEPRANATVVAQYKGSGQSAVNISVGLKSEAV